jgi:hypothetical protein
MRLLTQIDGNDKRSREKFQKLGLKYGGRINNLGKLWRGISSKGELGKKRGFFSTRGLKF